MGLQTILNITKVHVYGRVSIPVEIRNKLEIRDGDKIIWYLNDLGDICIKKMDIEYKKGVRYAYPK